MSSTDSQEKILNKCPICNSALEYHALMQYSDVYAILNNGKLSKSRKRKDCEGSMECGFIVCTECDFHTDCDLGVEEYKGIYIYQNRDKFLYECDENFSSGYQKF